MTDDAFFVTETPAGRGLFSRAPFSAGELVVVYRGVKIPTPIADILSSRYLFDLENGWTLEGAQTANIARFVNHSCKPNCEARFHDGGVAFFAARDIAENEEITIDYGEEYCADFIWPNGCKCASCKKKAA